MKIAAYECYPTSKRGGSEKAFFEVLSALNKIGHKIVLFYTIPGDLISKYEQLAIKCVQLKAFNVNYFNPKNWSALYQSAKIINNYQPDCIYINQLADSPLATFSKLLKTTKIVCHLRVPKTGESKLFNFCGQYIDLYITLNQLIKKQYTPIFGAQKIEVINDGIEIPDKHFPAKSEKSKSAVYLGRISPEKGLLALLNAWQVLKNQYNLTISLDITGPAVSTKELEHKAEIEKRIIELNLKTLVKINSPINNPITYFSDFDFSVFPSTIDESFGRTIPESILAGTPVFTRKVGIVEDILAPEKETFIFESEEELVRKIVRFYKNELYWDLMKLQQHIIENYDVKKNVLLIADKIKQVVQS